MESFLGGLGGGGGDRTGEKHEHGPPKSNAELFSSAKLLAGAAQSAFSGDKSEEVDKGKAAGAAEDLLGAASHYGKLEEKGYGEYVEKAETYLHQYSSTGPAKPASDEGKAHPAPAPETPQEPSSKPSGGGGGGEGYGDYLKMAQGFLK